MEPLSIDFESLRNDIETLSAIGREEDHGIYRMALSEADLAGRTWFEKRVREAGLEFHRDEAANLFGRLGPVGEKPSIMIGSHLDTVPGGGYLDGALGVLTGLACLRDIKAAGIEPAYPLEVAAFTDEEGRFGGMFGSQSLCGEMTPQRIREAVDLDGVRLEEAMAAIGLDAMDALRARRGPETLKGYVELHIEQGPVLDSMGLSAAVVSSITGLFKWSVTLEGRADHGGTTPIPMRRDAFNGLAEIANEIPRILEEHGGEHSVATIGKVDLYPGSANTVPGLVKFSLDVRDTDPEILADLANAFRRALSAIARRRQLMFSFQVLSEIEPAACDPEIMSVISKEAEAMGLPVHTMPSGAAHDAQTMSRITPVGMIFVPSKEGRSHSFAEWTHWDDIEVGANLTLRTLLRLANGV